MYVGMRYSSKVEGSTWKSVHCESCRSEWAYRVTRAATGEGRSPYMLDNEGAQQRARNAATANLERALANASDEVPCPKCMAYQPDMADRLRKKKFSWMIGLGVLGLVGTPMVVMPMIQGTKHDPSVLPMPVGIVLLVLGIVGSIAALVVRKQRMAAYDPNAQETLEDRRTVAATKTTILRERYEVLVASARAEGKADDIVPIRWSNSGPGLTVLNG